MGLKTQTPALVAIWMILPSVIFDYIFKFKSKSKLPFAIFFFS